MNEPAEREAVQWKESGPGKGNTQCDVLALFTGAIDSENPPLHLCEW